MVCSREVLRECGLVVKGDGWVVRAKAPELMPLLYYYPSSMSDSDL
jgi:hypothetical protein